MFAAANAKVVAGRLTTMVLSLARTASTRTLGTKFCCCSLMAMT
jgi:hypothetical protein